MRKLLLAALALSMASCDWEEFNVGSNRYKDDFHYSYPLKAGGRLYLENFNGSVEITGWEKDEVEINGTKYASTQETLSALKVDVVASPDSVRVRTVRPSERRGNMGVKYVIRAPRKVELDRIISSNGSIRVEGIAGNGRLKTSNGSVKAWRYHGNLEVGTSNGSIEVQEFEGGAVVKTSNGSVKAAGVRGYFEASTSNGSIDARVLEMDPNRPVKVDSSNGRIELTMEKVNGNEIVASTSNSSITLRLPAALNARVRASTTNSSITSEFDVNVQAGRLSKTHLEGTVGSGGPLVDVSTSNGAIRLLKI